MRTYRSCSMLFPASLKLALMCCPCLHHLLPWVASCSFVMHHACCASCLVHVWCVYHVMCFLSIVPVSLRSWGFVRLRLVRLHPFVFFMESFFFLAGFQARWPLPLDLTTIISILVTSFYCYAALPIHLFLKPPKLSCSASNLFTLPSKPLFGYVTAFAQPLL